MKLTPERNKAIAESVFRHIREGTTDLTEHVLAFDPIIYSGEDIAQSERENIFQAQPMMAAHVAEVPEYGNFIRLRLNTQDVILSRKKDGSIGAYLNICSHRGASVVNEDRGTRKIFTCKYHGWTYGNDGQSRGIGFQETFGAKPCAKLNLTELPVEVRHGFIWVVEDPAGSIDVAEMLGPEMDQAMSEFGFDDYHFYKGQILELNQNWKIMADGLVDGYHVKFLHGATISPYFYHNIMSCNILTHHSLHATPRRRIDEILDQEPGETSLVRYVIMSIHICPNAALVIHPHHVEFWTLYQHPDGPHKSRTHLRFITPKPMESEAHIDIMNKNYKILLDAVLNEDVPAGDSVQAASQGRGVQRFVLGRNEILNQLFHRNYDRLMQGRAPASQVFSDDVPLAAE